MAKTDRTAGGVRDLDELLPENSLLSLELPGDAAGDR